MQEVVITAESVSHCLGAWPIGLK